VVPGRRVPVFVIWTVVAAVIAGGTAPVLRIGTGVIFVGWGGVGLVWAGSQFNPVEELEAVVETPSAVFALVALEDDQTSCTQDRNRPGGRVVDDPDAAGDIANTDRHDPALLGVMGGGGQVLEGGPSHRLQSEAKHQIAHSL
jgi:hypothetical protein